MSYCSTKTYGHEEGLSCAFRQWRANTSHCHKVHGYALAFSFVFEADALDDRGWVMDFGGLKGLKQLLKDHFDHKLVVAADDPALTHFQALQALGVADIVVHPDGVGVERFARYAYRLAFEELHRIGAAPRVRVVSCTVSEHAGNSAVYINDHADEGAPFVVGQQ